MDKTNACSNVINSNNNPNLVTPICGSNNRFAALQEHEEEERIEALETAIEQN